MNHLSQQDRNKLVRRALGSRGPPDAEGIHGQTDDVAGGGRSHELVGRPGRVRQGGPVATGQSHHITDGNSSQFGSVAHAAKSVGPDLGDAALHPGGLGHRSNQPLPQQGVGHRCTGQDQIRAEPPGTALPELGADVLLSNGVDAHPHIRMQTLIFLQQGIPKAVMGLAALQPIHPRLRRHHDVKRFPVDQGQGSAALQHRAGKSQQGKASPQES